MIAEFTTRRGYDPRPWLPMLTGRVVESAAATERFLWDFRRTLSDLVAENHYDQTSALLKAREMGHYSESHEGGRAFIGDGMEAKRSADVPMGAMWTQQPGVNEENHGRQRRHPRVGVRRAPLRAEPCRRRVDDGGLERLGLVAGDAQADRRQGAGDGPQPLRDPHLRAPAARRQGPRPQPRPLRPVVHAQRNVGRAGAGLGDVPRALVVPPAAGPLRRRRPLLLRGGHERDGPLRRPGTAGAGGLRLRLRQRRRARAPRLGRGAARSRHRAACATACWRSTRTARQMSLPVLRRIRELVTAGAVVAGPKPLSTAQPRATTTPSSVGSRTSCGERAPARASTGSERAPSGRRQPGGRPVAPRRAARLRAHEAPGRHGVLVSAPRARRRRPLLREQPQRPGRGRRGHLPRERQGSRAVARGHGRSRAGVLPRRRRAHHRTAPPRAVGHGVRRVPPAGDGPVPDRAGDRRGRPGGRERPVAARASSPIAARPPASRWTRSPPGPITRTRA